MVTAKTAYDVEAEIRQLWQKYFETADDVIKVNPLVELLLQKILTEISKREIEYKIELAEDIAQGKLNKLEELEYFKFTKNIATSLLNHTNYLLNKTFGSDPDSQEFKKTVFDPANGDVEEQAKVYVEDRKQKAEETLADFLSAEGEEFKELLGKIDKYSGSKEKSLKLISDAFDKALECQRNDLDATKEAILLEKRAALEKDINSGQLTDEQIRLRFAEITEQLDANVKADLKQELEYIALREMAGHANEQLKNNGEAVTALVSNCGLNYCAANGEDVKLNKDEAATMAAFASDRMLDEIFENVSGLDDASRRSRFETLSSIFVSKGDGSLDLDNYSKSLEPILRKLSQGRQAQVYVTGLTDVEKRVVVGDGNSVKESLNQADMEPIKQAHKENPEIPQVANTISAAGVVVGLMSEDQQFEYLKNMSENMYNKGQDINATELPKLENLARLFSGVGIEYSRDGSGEIRSLTVYRQKNQEKVEGTEVEIFSR